MAPNSPLQDKADEWFNKFLPKLRFEQDYYVFPGSSKPIFDRNNVQTGIAIKRPDVRLYSTGVVKLYEMIVEGKEYPDIEYTEAEEDTFDKNMRKRFPEVFEGEEDVA